MNKETINNIRVYDLRSVPEESFISERDKIVNENEDVLGPIIITIDKTSTKTFFEYICAMPKTSMDKLNTLYTTADPDLLEILNLEAYHVYTLLSTEELCSLFEGMTSNPKQDNSQLWSELLKKLR